MADMRRALMRFTVAGEGAVFVEYEAGAETPQEALQRLVARTNLAELYLLADTLTVVVLPTGAVLEVVS